MDIGLSPPVMNRLTQKFPSHIQPLGEFIGGQVMEFFIGQMGDKLSVS